MKRIWEIQREQEITEEEAYEEAMREKRLLDGSKRTTIRKPKSNHSRRR